jgi:flagella basal body P-ring formation protein FlgA
MVCAGRSPATARASALALALCAATLVGSHASAAPIPRPDPTVSVELRPGVKVSRSQVRLGDVAYLTTHDLATLRQLMALPMGAAPRPGSPAMLDRETVERWIHAKSGLFAIRWAGPTEIEIESAALQLPGDTVIDAAQSALTRWLSERSLRAEVRPVSTARDLVLPAGKPTLHVRPIASQALPSRRMLVWVDAWVDDRFVRTTAVSFEVNAWAPVPVAAADVDRGVTVDPVVRHGALEEREVDLTTLRQGKPAVSAENSASLTESGQRLRRPLRSGELLTEAHLEPALAVTRGSSAELTARSGDVAIQSRVEVLQDGRPGQMVRVKVAGASGEVLARVTGPGQVEVQP